MSGYSWLGVLVSAAGTTLALAGRIVMALPYVDNAPLLTDLRQHVGRAYLLGEGRIGLAVKRRRGEPQAVEAALAETLAETARAAAFLEEDVPGLRFGTAELLVGFDDRLHAPSAEAFFGDAGPDLTRLAERSFAAEGRVSPAFEPRGPFRARLEGQPLALSALRERLLA